MGSGSRWKDDEQDVSLSPAKLEVFVIPFQCKGSATTYMSNLPPSSWFFLGHLRCGSLDILDMPGAGGL